MDPSCVAETGLAPISSPSLFEPSEQLVDHPVGGGLAIASFGDDLEELRALALGDEHVGVVGRKLVAADEALPLLVGQLGQVFLQAVDIALRQLQRQQVGIGEVAVVVRFLLGAHGARLALVGVEQPRFLIDPAAVFQNVDLPAGLHLDRLADEADRVDVLDLAARAELAAGLAHGDVHVGAQVALLHVAVAGAEIAHDAAQLGHVGLGLLGRAHVGLGHDLHQRHARAIEIDQGQFGVLVVDRLAGVLLQVQALDADLQRGRRRHRPPPGPRRRSAA